MIPGLPFYISATFIVATILSYTFLIIAVSKNNNAKITLTVSVIILSWLTLQFLLAKNDFYKVVNTVPPRIAFLIIPPLLLIILLFITSWGKKFINSLPPSVLTLLHSVRMLVELTLYWLFVYRQVPLIMTYAGWNFDIISGLSAIFVFYLGYVNKRIGKGFLIAWNIIGILLLLNIVIIAILSAPTVFQKFAYYQPNVAIEYFPFIWLPCFIVPTVLFSHLSVLKNLMRIPNTKL